MTGLDEISMEIGSLKSSVSNIQRQQEESHRVMFEKLDQISRTVTIGSVQIPAMKLQIDDVEKTVGILEKEKHERKGALWGISMTSGAVGGIVTAVAEFFSRHS